MMAGGFLCRVLLLFLHAAPGSALGFCCCLGSHQRQCKQSPKFGGTSRLSMDATTKPTAGNWYWKEDTKTLEFARASPISFRALLSSKTQDRAYSARRQSIKRGTDHIMLEDVKEVALGLLGEQERRRVASFTEFIRGPVLDDFLMSLLFYLSCYLEKVSLEMRPRSIMANTSVADMKEIEDALTKTKSAEKHFAHIYCSLVLGLGFPKQHHMACGKSKVSATHRDRHFYESLYNFCSYVGWVVFRRKDLKLIQGEVGRLLRSDTFNPALRQKGNSEEQKARPSYERKKIIKPSNKRPAITDIISQRSPALISLMPSPKEKAEYLFQQHSLHPDSTHKATDSCNWMEEPLTVFSHRLGILGQPRKLFNPETLAPLSGEDDEKGGKKSTASFHDAESVCHREARSGPSRISTLFSRATTEGGYSDPE